MVMVWEEEYMVTDEWWCNDDDDYDDVGMVMMIDICVFENCYLICLCDVIFVLFLTLLTTTGTCSNQ